MAEPRLFDLRTGGYVALSRPVSKAVGARLCREVLPLPL